ncbi:unnamed protein product [Aphanomyces euteiches]|uniref:Uncharacterized protein n=1 Tax=Aphanomyces euteiches TaxID=100861 RepID=A0A6G0XDR3_9STRA|nr:hypothetical protein Ae201684_005806 [Aphanomyces euteiches]KAH9078913.1 hypothetical protein Ae201684P_019976 [Aphanomyces euteiches]KAH9144573.1 hypothetical protein AeRB84_011492 [Aphanomyces euteiches]
MIDFLFDDIAFLDHEMLDLTDVPEIQLDDILDDIQSDLLLNHEELAFLQGLFRTDAMTLTTTIAPTTSMIAPANTPRRSRKACSIPGCFSFARCRGLCTQHGGRHLCSEENCSRVAQYGGKCTAHGGIRPCTVAGCIRSVQSHGKCKTHGGGTRCKVAGCTKGSISNGRCRGHGGGKRCQAAPCTKWAQTDGYCTRHHRDLVA